MASTNLASATAQPLHEESSLPSQQFHPREFSFPWKSNPWDLDWEKAAVATWLFLVCFLILSPDIYNWRLWHLRKRDGSDRIQVLPPEESASPRRVSSTTCSTTVCVGVMGEEEETEEEFFQKHYATIRVSPYRRLVLPPECKRLDRPPVHKPKIAKEVPQIQVYDEDHPLRRLEYYAKSCLELLRSILSYDYASAVRTVSNWLQLILKMRSKKTPEVTEDDDDDLSIASSVTFKSAGAQVQEEKKDEGRTLLRRSSSLYENALCADSGEAEVTKSPLGLRQRSLTKKKDALDAYRSAIPGRPPPRSPKSPDPVHTVHFMGERSPPRRQQRETSDGMSYFDAAHSKESLHRLNVEVPVPDQNGYIVGDEFLANSRVTPLLVFVNSRSGPQQGQLLITQLRRLLNPIQIWDLSDGGPEKVLQSFCVMTRLRILVCGGDGTVSWIISALEQMNLPRNPPIAILPLGTGNDLARMHGWGGGYNNESLICILEQVAESYISLLDRWEMTIESRKGRVMMTKSFFNYLGVGVDAQAALQVHMLRESRPKLFFSRVVNKAWYAVFGAEDAIKASHANLPNEIVLIADGVEVPLPDDSQGIILLNIDSYSGGVPMWALGTKPEQSRISLDSFALQPKYGPRRVHSFDSIHKRDAIVASMDRTDSMDDLNSASLPVTDEEKLDRVMACDMPSSCQDGILDIVSVQGAFHLGQIRVGLSNAKRLCQCREVTIIIKPREKVAVQIDGEPWRQSAGTLRVSRKKDPAMMLHRSPDESGGVETEMAKLLDWAEERKIIDRSAHATMMKEFSRRIESKTRQRRVKSQDNLMQSLKRAISTRNTVSSTSPGTSTFSGSLTF